jgi:hypothetical protein
LVATRDVNPFLAMGATVINPWEELPAPRAMSVVEALAMPEPDDIDLEHYLPKRRRE